MTASSKSLSHSNLRQFVPSFSVLVLFALVLDWLLIVWSCSALFVRVPPTLVEPCRCKLKRRRRRRSRVFTHEKIEIISTFTFHVRRRSHVAVGDAPSEPSTLDTTDRVPAVRLPHGFSHRVLLLDVDANSVDAVFWSMIDRFYDLKRGERREVKEINRCWVEKVCARMKKHSAKGY